MVIYVVSVVNKTQKFLKEQFKKDFQFSIIILKLLYFL